MNKSPLVGLSFCDKEAFQEATSRGIVLPMVWDGPLSKESNPIEARYYYRLALVLRFDVVESNKRSSGDMEYRGIQEKLGQ